MYYGFNANISFTFQAVLSLQKAVSLSWRNLGLFTDTCPQCDYSLKWGLTQKPYSAGYYCFNANISFMFQAVLSPQNAVSISWRNLGLFTGTPQCGYSLTWKPYSAEYYCFNANVSFTFQSIKTLCLTHIWRFRAFLLIFLVIFGYFKGKIVFLKGWVKVMAIRNFEDLMLFWTNQVWS